ncbi:putative transposase (fragment) [Xenorhabdus nematophila F1]|uniref:Transposase n=1 Tax=Xenorhabdus nematophila (strain ATCC 19061 / DSM 3370 / CCUG 14189 / LMG 1036 / NCIMB 9965 / AN6) TaxID=406817 RepID=D3VEJ1_XENNA
MLYDLSKCKYTDYTKKDSDLFINMLDKLKRQYHDAETLTVILDNYCIHKSMHISAHEYLS